MNNKTLNNPRASTLSSTRGSNPSVSGGPTEDELKQQQQMETAMKPLMYTTTDGKEVEIKNASDLKEAVRADFDPSKLLDEGHLGASYAKAVQTRFADATAKGEPFVDEKFLRLITKIKPDVEYYKMT